MSRTETTLSDAEWEAKFNGPRNALIKRLFGDKLCPVTDISPVYRVIDKDWGKTGPSANFMNRVRITNPMNVSTEGLENHRSGHRMVKKVSLAELEIDKLVAPVK